MAPDTKVPARRTAGRTAGRTDNTKTISLRLWRGIITIPWTNINLSDDDDVDLVVTENDTARKLSNLSTVKWQHDSVLQGKQKLIVFVDKVRFNRLGLPCHLPLQA
ncbi:hypothetical protein DPMN_045571, partial [Dreissena polymorpha]